MLGRHAARVARARRGDLRGRIRTRLLVPPDPYGVRSTAPTSHPPPWGRGTPRWSVAGHSAAFAVSRAGLPASGTCVGVGPPLSESGPSSAVATTWSVAMAEHDP